MSRGICIEKWFSQAIHFPAAVLCVLIISEHSRPLFISHEGSNLFRCTWLYPVPLTSSFALNFTVLCSVYFYLTAITNPQLSPLMCLPAVRAGQCKPAPCQVLAPPEIQQEEVSLQTTEWLSESTSHSFTALQCCGSTVADSKFGSKVYWKVSTVLLCIHSLCFPPEGVTGIIPQNNWFHSAPTVGSGQDTI